MMRSGRSAFDFVLRTSYLAASGLAGEGAGDLHNQLEAEDRQEASWVCLVGWDLGQGGR